MLLEQAGIERRARAGRARGVGEEPAEVGVAARRTRRGAVTWTRLGREGHLGAGDRPHAERLRRVGELERAVDAVVVGQRERRVAELGRPHGKLLGQRGAVEERVRRVAVELDVGHARSGRERSSAPRLPSAGASPGLSHIRHQPGAVPPSAHHACGSRCAVERVVEMGAHAVGKVLRPCPYARCRYQRPASSSRKTAAFSPVSSTTSK